MTEDAQDLAAAREGGAEGHRAFARLYDRHAAVVLSLCRQHAPEAPEDALQETFIRAYRMLDKLDAPDGFRSWLYAIARRVCSERRRSDRRRSHHEHAAAMNHTLNHAAQTTPPLPAAAAGRAEQLARLGDALDHLPDDQRLAIHLYYLDPDPISAAGDALGISRSGFYKLLARARDTLATLLKEAHA
jgi:RNA polymerase sigma-70 factor (ECF subfamily)